MVSSFVSIILAAAAMVANAQVYPTEPAGESYKVGSNITITWTGDKNSTTAWKNMAIELMCGDNDNMVHLTTVITDQDGTVDGQYVHIVPDVTLYAKIYFYQFSAPAVDPSGDQWTTRFTIEGTDGSSVPAPNATQPDGKPIPWGVAALKDPSTAQPAPPFANQGAAATANPAGSSTTSSPTGSTPTPVGQSTPLSSPTTTPSKMITSSLPSPTSNSNSSTGLNSNSTTPGKSGAISGHSLDIHFLQTAFVLFATSMGFLVLL